jgi:hypothetical protein
MGASVASIKIAGEVGYAPDFFDYRPPGFLARRKDAAHAYTMTHRGERLKSLTLLVWQLEVEV